MEKPYYAIFLRTKNNYPLDDYNDYDISVMKVSAQSYSEAYKAYQTLLQDLPDIKQIAFEKAIADGIEANKELKIESCIVRISPMTDWVDIETSK